MATKKASKSVRKSRSWKDIDQDVKAKSMSSAAFKRMLLARMRTCAIGVGVFVALALVIKFFVMTDDFSATLTKAGRALPIRVVEVESDTLSREWVMEHLDLYRGDLNLLEIDVGALRASLLKIPQTREAHIARQLPDTLFISIEEREPIARVAAEDVERGRITLLVDRDGIVYEGIGYNRKRIQSLPFLDGIRLKRIEGGFETIEGMNSVDHLLAEASEIAPHIYQTWKVVSLAELPKLIVKSAFAKEIVFAPTGGDYRRQLSELDYIIDYHKGHSYRSVAKIDLTMKSQVPVTRSTVVR